MIKICLVVGARPNFMKAAPIIKEMQKRGKMECVLIHTNQHYDKNLSDFFFRDLSLPAPIVLYNISSEGIRQIAEMKISLEEKLKELRPDLVIVVGDVNSTYAAAYVANRLNIPVAHVEAGLRSFDRSMPEEINRMLVDVLCDYHFVTEISGKNNLLREGINENKIHFVGNTMIDSLMAYKDIADEKSKILDELNLMPKKYAVLTIHRPANVDNKEEFAKLSNAILEIQNFLKIVFPVHPRTKKNINDIFNTPNIIITEPLGYLDFLKLMMHSALILTDSGGIQEEATVLRVPCITLRENTERPSTIDSGANRLVGRDSVKVAQAVKDALANPCPEIKIPELWDGRAAERIINILEKKYDRI